MAHVGAIPHSLQVFWNLKMKKRGTTMCYTVCTTLCLLFLGLAIVILVLNQIGFFKEKVNDYVREVWNNKACIPSN